MESGAKAAISGFRLQALYTLDLILQEGNGAKKFQPEGKEDLAIFQNGILVRAIQVKAYSAPLKLSDLSPRRENSLLGRLINSGDSSAVVELASFGPLGPELEAVQRREDQALAKLSEKLGEYGYSPDEVNEILHRLEIVRVNESATSERVFRFLKHGIASGDPDRAFDLLVWWVLRAAENRRRLSFRDLRDQLLLVGRYLAERNAHHDEWFTTIKPLQEEQVSSPASIERLAEEYFRGTAARYPHICAGLDVRRNDQLELIDRYFSDNKAIIIHGASGQGKTSLAMRYFHDYVPADWRFMVASVDDRRHAAKIANALADHLRVVDAPVWLFIDVAPRDLQWVVLVRELLDIENVRILVAIREEDLARRTVSESELGFPADIRLDFTERDAYEIYSKLVARGDAPNAFPTFSEAWERFGGEGPLLEFVYLITQTESLRSVLASQVQRLREEVRLSAIEPEALRLLHLCALVTSFEARINIVPLTDNLRLRDPVGTVGLFENEFLLRVSPDRTQVEALHPVRSSLLAKELQDAAFAGEEEVALQAIPFIPEVDLEVYILYLLSRIPGCWGRFREVLLSLEVRTWTGAAGIGRALLWWGIKSYLTENRSTIEEARRIGGDVWAMLILPDIAGALDTDLGETLLELLGRNNLEMAELLRGVRGKLTPRLQVFKPLRDWLTCLGMRGTPVDLPDWEGFGEISFWAGHLGISPPMSLRPADLPVSSLPIEALARLCLALFQADPAEAPDLIRVRGDELKARFREEEGVLILREDSESVTAEFLVSFDFVVGARRREDAEGSGTPSLRLVEGGVTQRADASGKISLSSALNDEAVRRVEYLRALFPRKERYCTQGHGHQLRYGGIGLPSDSTVKRMPPQAVPISWLVRVNATLNSLEIYRCRPRSWRDFAKLVLEARETLALTLLQLHRALVSYFESGSARSLFGGTLSVELWDKAAKCASADFYLPMSAVDEWGLSSETQAKGSKDSEFSASIASAFSRRYNQPFLEALRGYMSSISNFLKQALIICNVHGFVGRNARNRDKLLEVAASQFGYDDATIRLSALNLFQGMLSLGAMQNTFDERVGSLVDLSKLAQVKRREINLFPALWALWFQFCHFPEKRLRDANGQSLSAMEDSLASTRESLRSGIGSEGWRVIMIRDGFYWEGHPALVLRLELDLVRYLEIARSSLLLRLDTMLRAAEFGSLMRYALEYFWRSILIVPTIGGVALDSTAWVVPAFVFPGDSEGEPSDRPWLRLWHSLSSEQVHELGIELSAVADVQVFKDLLEALSGLHLTFSHLSLFADLEQGLDILGRRVLEKDLRKASEHLTEGFERVRELVPQFLRRIRQSKAGTQEELDELLVPFQMLRAEVETPSTTIVLGECEAKARQFENLIGLVSALRLVVSFPEHLG